MQLKKKVKSEWGFILYPEVLLKHLHVALAAIPKKHSAKSLEEV
jgi:hypothetical protein